MGLVRFTLLFIAIVLPCMTWAAFKHYSIEDGLSQSVVFDIQQDQQGFMWFSTQAGLNRFDGAEFRVFSTHENENSLTNNYIYPLAIDNKERLFIGTRHGGVNRLDLFNYSFAKAQLPQQRITSLLTDSQFVYVGTYSGHLYRIDTNAQAVTLLTDEIAKPIYKLAKIEHGLWIGTQGAGLVFYNLKTEKVQHNYFQQFAYERPLHDSIFAIKQADNGDIWVGSQGGGLYKFNMATKEVINWRVGDHGGSSINHNQIRDIEIDKSQRVWLATRGGGINILDLKTNHFQYLLHDPFDHYSLSHNRVYSIFQDATGVMWFGTAKGVSKLNTQSLNFIKLKKPKPLSSDDAWVLYQDKQRRFWYGSWGGGIDIFDDNYQRLAHLSSSTTPIKLASNAIKTITEDNVGNVWVGTWDNGINIITADSKVRHFTKTDSRSGLTENSIYALLVLNSNDVLVGTNGGGLFKYNPQSDKFFSLREQNTLGLSIPSLRVISLFQPNEEQLWIGTDGDGAYHYNFVTKQLTHFSKASAVNHISHNTVRSFLQINNQTWLATSDGINIVDFESNQVTHLSQQQGLPNNVIYALLRDDNGQVWISTNNGIAKINPDTYSVTSFKAKHGLQGNEFNAGAYLKAHDGRLLFGGTQGVSVVKPNINVDDLQSAKIALTRLQLDDGDLHLDGYNQLGSVYQIEKSREVFVPANTKRISFTLGYLHYAATDSNRYQYRLEGFEEQWRTAIGERFTVDYTNLAPGQYKLLVKATNAAGVSALSPLLINIAVAAPWWQTIWFYITCCFAIALLFWLFTWLWTRRIRMQKWQLQQAVTQRTQELASQKSIIEQQAEALSDSLENKVRFFTHASHELRTPLSLLISPLQKLISVETQSNKREQLNLILRNSRRLENLVDKLLTLTRYDERNEEVIKVISLSAIAREVAAQFSVLKKSDVEFISDIEEALFINATREGLVTILTNLLSNAFKYTSEGRITLRVQAEENQALINVSDTGKGIADVEKDKIFDLFYRSSSQANVEGSGVGLSIVKRLVDKYKGRIKLESKLSHGASFSVEFEMVKLQQQTKALPAHVEIEDSELPSVLIIEDNDELRHYLKSELELRYQVYLAENGRTGIELAQKYVPDLVITDLMMPQVDGFEVLKVLHASPITCHIPIIVLTAKGDFATRLSGLQKHALDVIAKPFEREELLVKVENWINWVNRFADKPQSIIEHKVNATREIEIDPKDRELLTKLNDYLAIHYSRHDLTTPGCAKALALSERQFQRKLKALANMTPSEFIRDFRLAKAAELLQQGTAVNLVIDEVGFTSRSHFSRSFKAKFGVTAKEYSIKSY